MEELRRLGLTKYESLIYKALLIHGRCNAEDVSNFSQVPKTAVYPNLRSLVKKGLVQETHGETSLFDAFPPKAALEVFIKIKSKNLEILKNEALNALSTLNKVDKVESKEVLWLTRGREASSSFYYSAFDEAKKTYFILGWRFQKIGDKYNLLREFKKLIKRGVDVRLLVNSKAEEINKPLLKDYLNAGVKVKRTDLQNFSIVVVDNKKCKITLKDRSIGDKYNIAILDENLSRAMHSYFLDCWKVSQKIV